MKCEEILSTLNEYVDGELDPALSEAIRAHLEDCPPCDVVIDNVRHTITLYRAGKPIDMPPELQQQLNGLLRQRWKAKFPNARLEAS